MSRVLLLTLPLLALACSSPAEPEVEVEEEPISLSAVIDSEVVPMSQEQRPFEVEVFGNVLLSGSLIAACLHGTIHADAWRSPTANEVYLDVWFTYPEVCLTEAQHHVWEATIMDVPHGEHRLTIRRDGVSDAGDLVWEPIAEFEIELP